MAEELGEKTEEPTPHRMNKARDEGQVAWSKDFASFVVLCSGTIALMLLAMFGTGLLKDWLAFGLNRATGGSTMVCAASGMPALGLRWWFFRWLVWSHCWRPQEAFCRLASGQRPNPSGSSLRN